MRRKENKRNGQDKTYGRKAHVLSLLRRQREFGFSVYVPAEVGTRATSWIACFPRLRTSHPTSMDSHNIMRGLSELADEQRQIQS